MGKFFRIFWCIEILQDNSSVVEDDKMCRAVLMKNHSQASFSGKENHQEDRLSWKVIFKVQGSTATSDVVVDKNG
jgi:hypothetical protein